MNIADKCKVNKIFVNDTSAGTFTRATLAFSDHRGRELWISYNVPRADADSFKAKFAEGTEVLVEGLLYADNYKNKNDVWVNRTSIDVSSIELA